MTSSLTFIGIITNCFHEWHLECRGNEKWNNLNNSRLLRGRHRGSVSLDTSKRGDKTLWVFFDFGFISRFPDIFHALKSMMRKCYISFALSEVAPSPSLLLLVCASTLSNSGPREFHSHFSCSWNRARGADISALTTVTKYKKIHDTKNVMKKELKNAVESRWKIITRSWRILSTWHRTGRWHSQQRRLRQHIFPYTQHFFHSSFPAIAVCCFFVFSRVNFYAIIAADTSLGLGLYAKVSGRR